MKTAATWARIQIRLPFGIDYLVGRRRRRKLYENTVGVVEGRKPAAGIAISIGKVTEPGMEKGIAEGLETMLAIALVQGKHGPIIALFRGMYEGQADRAMHRRGS